VGPPLSLPLGAATVHDAGVGVAIELEEPEAIGSVPVVLVAVEDDDGIVADAVAAQEGLEVRLVHKVAAHRILHIHMPVELDGVGYVADRLIEQGIFIGLDNADPGVAEVIGNPLGIYQNLWMEIAGLWRGAGRAHLCFCQSLLPLLSAAS